MKKHPKFDDDEIGAFTAINCTVDSRNPMDFTVAFLVISAVLGFDPVMALLENLHGTETTQKRVSKSPQRSETTLKNGQSTAFFRVIP